MTQTTSGSTSVAIQEYETIKRAERAIERGQQQLSKDMQYIRPQDMNEYVRISTQLEKGRRPILPATSASEALHTFQAIVRAEERKDRAWVDLRKWLRLIPQAEMNEYFKATGEIDEMYDEQEVDE